MSGKLVIGSFTTYNDLIGASVSSTLTVVAVITFGLAALNPTYKTLVGGLFFQFVEAALTGCNTRPFYTAEDVGGVSQV